MDVVLDRGEKSRVALVLAGIALGGLLGAVLVGPLVLVNSRRQVTIHNAVNSSRLGGAVLGNSTVMTGVDAETIASRLPDLRGQPIYNVSSGGQRLLESLLIGDSLPPSCKSVVLGVSLWALCIDDQDLPQSVCASYSWAGFKPKPEFVRLARDLGAKTAVDSFEASSLERAVDSRWALRHLLNTRIRQILRPDMDLAFSETTAVFAPTGLPPTTPTYLRRRYGSYWRETWRR